MIDKIDVIIHSSIFIDWDKSIYIDPYNIPEGLKKADYIFITHSHYDHYSREDINKIIKSDTKIICPLSMKNEIDYDNVVFVKPLDNINLDGIEFFVTHSYNTNKSFHPKENMWVGYILKINNELIYISGDTDVNDDIRDIKCDIALVPIGGVYTMDYMEAADYINSIKPKYVIPIHYGSVVGDVKLGVKFSELIDKDIDTLVKIK